MKPVAWACFAENGNIRIWSPDQEPVRKAAEREGWEITPLYSQDAVDKFKTKLRTDEKRKILDEGIVAGLEKAAQLMEITSQWVWSPDELAAQIRKLAESV